MHTFSLLRPRVRWGIPESSGVAGDGDKKIPLIREIVLGTIRHSGNVLPLAHAQTERRRQRLAGADEASSAHRKRPHHADSGAGSMNGAHLNLPAYQFIGAKMRQV